jgi:hypothetical protein
VPGGDGGVGRTAGRLGTVPQFHSHRLACRQPAKPFDWSIAVRRAEVLAKTEVCVVCGQQVDHALIALRDFHLRHKRIGLNIEAPLDRAVFIANLLRAGDIEEGVGITIELRQLSLAQAVAASTLVAPAETPAIGESVRLERRQHHGDVAGRVGGHVVEARIVDPTRRVLDVVRVVAEPPQPDEVMQELIRYARQRVEEQNSEDDDFAF